MSAAQQRSVAAYERLRRRILADVPSVDPNSVDALLAEAHVDSTRTVRQIDTYLSNHPDGLSSPDSSCPLGMVRLTRVLAARGHPVRPPECARCGHRLALPFQGPNGRVCKNCHSLTRSTICTSCGYNCRAYARFGEELLCRNCYRKDPRSQKVCNKCGRVRCLEQRDPNGEPLCSTCAPRPLHTCIECGRERPAHARLPSGPVCLNCYTRDHQPARRCGRCGNTAPITVRATADQPDICRTCSSADAGRRRTAAKPPKPPAAPRPRAPRAPKRPRLATCVLCHQRREIPVIWPIGPVCHTCYHKVKEHPADCALCGEVQVLIAHNDNDELICGPCAASPFDYRCATCGTAGRIYANDNCFRCCLDTRLTQLLGGENRQIPDHLSPLIDALRAAEKPRSVLVWLNKSAAARLLAELAAHPEAPTHAVLDSFAPSRSVHFIRRMLIDTGILPNRMDYLDRTVPWLEATLSTHPPAHARLIRTYAQWHLLPRARRKAQHQDYRASAASGMRSGIVVALEFLTWLDEQHLTLHTLSQCDIDQWLTETDHSFRNYIARGFLKWTASEGLSPRNVAIPAMKPGRPKNFAEAEDYTQQLYRCLHDQTLPTDIRAGGALILLYGIPTADVVTISRSQLLERAGEHHLQIAQTALLLPPLLAALLHQLPLARQNRTVIRNRDKSADLIFPGFNDTVPITAGAFGNQLRHHGITPRSGRNTARLNLAAELPASVLADLVGIHDATATRWAHLAGRDWQTYLAQRRIEQSRINNTE